MPNVTVSTVRTDRDAWVVNEEVRPEAEHLSQLEKSIVDLLGKTALQDKQHLGRLVIWAYNDEIIKLPEKEILNLTMDVARQLSGENNYK